MKLALLAALIGVISAEACNDTLQAKFWNDAKCTQLDKGLTGKHGKPPAEMMKFADGKCHSQGAQSMTISCSAKSMDMKMY